MSVANFPFPSVTYRAVSAINTNVPATALDQAAGTSVPILRRVDATEIVFSPPKGVYELFADCTLNIANAETFAQQIELQVVRVDAAGGVVQNVIASQVFALNRLGYAGGAAVATFATINNVDYHLSCGRGALEVNAGQLFTCRVLVNGNPIGGSVISNVSFLANLQSYDLTKVLIV